MNDRCIRVSAYVDGREVGVSRSRLRCAFVERDEFLEVELFASIALDALHDALAAYGAVVRYVVVHAAVLLRAEYTAGVHVAAFVNVDDVAVARVENQVAPAHFVHLAGKLQIIVPAETFGPQHCVDVSAACAVACIDKCIVVDVFIAEFAEAVAAGLMLNHAA